MKYYNFLTIFLMVIFIVSIGYAHGDEHKKKQKVTSKMMNSENSGTMMGDHNGMNGENQDMNEENHGMNEENHGMSEGHMSNMDAHMESDFEIIRRDVEDSATFVTLKAVSLAAALLGLALIYLPRRKKEEHNA